MNDDDVLRNLGDALQPEDREVPADRLAAFRAHLDASGIGEPAPPADLGHVRSRRTLLVGGVAAALGAAVGVAATVAAVGDDDGGGEVAGPPTQPVEFDVVPTGATVEGRSIDHTWGMELLLDVQGLPLDRRYAVEFATADGAVSAGGFLSVDALMTCRFNATVLLADVTEVTVVDEATGDVALRGRPA